MDETCKLDKPKTTKRYNINNPWITDGLVHSIETKYLLFKTGKKLCHQNFLKVTWKNWKITKPIISI